MHLDKILKTYQNENKEVRTEKEEFVVTKK